MTTPETRNALLPPDRRTEPVNLDELSAQEEPAAAEERADQEPAPDLEAASEPEVAPAAEEPAGPEPEPEPAPAADLEVAAAPEPAGEAEEPTNFISDDESDVDSDAVPVARADLPDLTEDATLEAALEALLLVVDSPAEEELLATALEVPIDRIAETLQRMAAAYAEQTRGIDLRKVGGGWRFYTRDKFAPFVEKLLLDGQRARLTRAALETLAVIAYRQPVTRQRVAAVRGVNVDGVIRTLLARGLIEETGTDSETGGFLFRTTELFLERIGLSSLEDLPPIAPLLPEVDAIDDV